MRRRLALLFVVLLAGASCATSEAPPTTRAARPEVPSPSTSSLRDDDVIRVAGPRGDELEGVVSAVDSSGFVAVSWTRGSALTDDRLGVPRGERVVSLVVDKVLPGCCVASIGIWVGKFPVSVGDRVFTEERADREAKKAANREIDVIVKGDLREVMDQIGRQVGKNIVVEPEIHEEVEISLKRFPWRDAVEVIAKMCKCNVEERGPILVVTQQD